ncbi:hypothetical protein [Roseibium album]
MSLNNDFQFYTVVCDLDGHYTPERPLSEMTFDKIVSDIADGQLERVVSVFEFNPAEGWSNDVTADVMAAAIPEQEEEDFSDYSADRITADLAGVQTRVAA